MKKQFPLLMLLVSTMLLTTASQAEDTKPKHSLQGSMEVEYNVVPQKADTFLEVFTKGEYYGRLRSNAFDYRWNEETIKNINNHAWGVGGSLVYKTAPFYGIGTTLGAYYSYAVDHLAQDDISFTKSGKDVFSRYLVWSENNYNLFALAQASVNYTLGKSRLEYGAQIFESVFTRSNDTKMIPNTFNGLTFVNNDLNATTFKAALFTSQKLRDHTTFHDVITFDDRNTTLKTDWIGNDDSAIHQGLNYTNFAAAGASTDHILIIATAKSKFGKNLKTQVSYASVPEVVSYLALEGHYIINADKTKIIPGVRYMLQMDNGGGVIGGASLKGDVNATNAALKGYTRGDSLNGGLIAARIDVAPEGMFKYRLGYSYIFDQADIVAPWRGFPTGGFTRAMAQYNWVANTTTYMVRIDGKISESVKFLVRYAVQDFDDAKSGAQADTNILHTDWMFNLSGLTKGLEAKVRIGLVSDQDTGTKANVSYNEYRFELNYLF